MAAAATPCEDDDAAADYCLKHYKANATTRLDIGTSFGGDKKFGFEPVRGILKDFDPGYLKVVRLGGHGKGVFQRHRR